MNKKLKVSLKYRYVAGKYTNTKFYTEENFKEKV